MITMHPGAFLRTALLEPLNISQAVLARHLDVTRGTVSRLLAEKADLSPEMAVRLELAFGNSAEYWMEMQTQHNLRVARKSVDSTAVTRFDIDALAAAAKLSDARTVA